MNFNFEAFSITTTDTRLFSDRTSNISSAKYQLCSPELVHNICGNTSSFIFSFNQKSLSELRIRTAIRG
jgi:hypothetical protein